MNNEKRFYIIRWGYTEEEFICVAMIKESHPNAEEISQRWLSKISEQYICKRYLTELEDQAITKAIEEWKASPNVLKRMYPKG